MAEKFLVPQLDLGVGFFLHNLKDCGPGNPTVGGVEVFGEKFQDLGLRHAKKFGHFELHLFERSLRDLVVEHVRLRLDLPFRQVA